MSRRRRKKKRVSRKLNRQYNRNRKQIQRDVKDRLFRYLFEKDREALLDLYNALNETEYQMVIEKAGKSLYGSGQISLPTPQ